MRDVFINSIPVVTGQKLPMKIRLFSWKVEAVVIFQEHAMGRESKPVQSQAMMMMKMMKMLMMMMMMIMVMLLLLLLLLMMMMMMMMMSQDALVDKISRDLTDDCIVYALLVMFQRLKLHLNNPTKSFTKQRHQNSLKMVFG